MLLLIILFLATCFLSYSNGANDNFKGVATLFGSGTTDYKTAIGWATITTFTGSVCSIFLAESLVKSFSGKGLVPDAIAASPDFLIAVALGAGFTVMLASVRGFPISTTHSLIGALAGSGLIAVGTQVNFTTLTNSFFLPLLLSPFIAVFMGSIVYGTLRCIRIHLGIKKEWCICIGETEKFVPIPQPNSALSFNCITWPGPQPQFVRTDELDSLSLLDYPKGGSQGWLTSNGLLPDALTPCISRSKNKNKTAAKNFFSEQRISECNSITTIDAVLDSEENCKEHYRGKVLGINCQSAIDFAHFISAGIVSFARGLNDTPKIVALLLAIKALDIRWGMAVVAVGMAAGGLINARKVAETMSKKIVSLNHGQGFTANLVTGLLVVFASRLGIPVSTTHVSVGSLFGIGLITRKANIRVISGILLSWILTLPIAAILSGCIYWALT